MQGEMKEDERDEKRERVMRELRGRRGWGGGWGVKSHRLFSTFSIMTLAWIHTQLLNHKYPGELIHFEFFGWREAAVVRG